MERARAELMRHFEWTHGHADFAGMLRSGALLDAVGPALVGPFRSSGVTAIVGIEARGFVFGALAARALGVGLVLARKPGSVHPGADAEVATTPDWRGRHIELRVSAKAVRPGDRFLLVDDWVETGSQARTVARLVERLGAGLVGVSAIVDDTTEETRTSLGLIGILRSHELPAT